MIFCTDHGTIYTVRVLDRPDLDRQLVKSETCTIVIPELEMTIPPGKGQLTTVEGLLRDIVTDLGADQPLRRIQAEEAYKKIQNIIDTINAILGINEDNEEESDSNTTGEIKVNKASDKDLPMQPFTLKLDDPTGNSFIEFLGSMVDPKWNLRTFSRTRQQNIDLGLAVPIESDENEAKRIQAAAEAEDGLGGKNEEIYVFPGTCSSCSAPLDTMMKKVSIPYFKVFVKLSIISFIS